METSADYRFAFYFSLWRASAVCIHLNILSAAIDRDEQHLDIDGFQSPSSIQRVPFAAFGDDGRKRLSFATISFLIDHRITTQM